ncbi:MAG: flagellar protein FlaG [Rouxiella aceris]|uniref:flagellar protein FlaG n=1 Tax=Rouxiella aceris TaxID=2703884 RepID=UPI00284E381B|nr:flagellar protein FlaG [Rouxiella aceris]MDR3432233.1 flagellar protein FlaG [Rouxiella aceris]
MQALSPTNAFTLSSAEPITRQTKSATTTATIDVAGGVRPADTVTAQAVQAVATQNDTEKVKDSLQRVNSVVKAMGRELDFSVDDETHARVVKVVDTQTHEVIKQIPSEEVLRFAAALDHLQGLLFKDKV